jgi:hypothetical protein
MVDEQIGRIGSTGPSSMATISDIIDQPRFDAVVSPATTLIRPDGRAFAKACKKGGQLEISQANLTLSFGLRSFVFRDCRQHY